MLSEATLAVPVAASATAAFKMYEMVTARTPNTRYFINTESIWRFVGFTGYKGFVSGWFWANGKGWRKIHEKRFNDCLFVYGAHGNTTDARKASVPLWMRCSYDLDRDRYFQTLASHDKCPKRNGSHPRA